MMSTHPSATEVNSPVPNSPNSPRRQHYVPQFYLKNFIPEGTDRDGPYLWATDLSVDPPNTCQVTARSQAAKDYYYGKDPAAERWLSSLEGDAAPVIDALKTKTPEDIDVVMRMTLILFIGTLTLRTEKALSNMRQFSEFTRRHMNHDIPTAQEITPTALLQAAVTRVPILFDLNLAIADCSRCNIRFGTSDSPVLTGSYYEKSTFMSSGSSQLFDKPGSIFFLPISPFRMLLCYDPACYVAHSRGSILENWQESDSVKLNEQQALHAHRFVFSAEKPEIGSATKIMAMRKRLRPGNGFWDFKLSCLQPKLSQDSYDALRRYDQRKMFRIKIASQLDDLLFSQSLNPHQYLAEFLRQLSTMYRDLVENGRSQ